MLATFGVGQVVWCKVHEHQVQAARGYEKARRDYLQSMAGATPSLSRELTRLAELKQQSVIDDVEFGRLKAKVIG